jgi:hypothetical protein
MAALWDVGSLASHCSVSKLCHMKPGVCFCQIGLPRGLHVNGYQAGASFPP